MPVLTEAQLKKQIADRKFERIYWIYGEECYLIRYYTDRIQEVCVGELKDFNLQFLDQKASMDDLLAAAEQLPVMSDYRCVVVRDLDIDKIGASEYKIFQEFLDHLPKGCVLIFYYENIHVKKTAKWKNILKAAEKNGAVLKFDRLSEQPLANLLCSAAAKRGCQMHITTARNMIETCGNDLRTLLGELDKLCAFVSAKGVITIQDIEMVCTKSMEASVFQLSKYITAGKEKEAFTLLNKLFYQRAEPIAVLSALSMAYIDMYRAKSSVSVGKKAEEAAQDFGCKSSPWRYRNAGVAASGISLAALRKSIILLNEADVKMKSSRMDSKIMLQQTVMQLLLLKAGV